MSTVAPLIAVLPLLIGWLLDLLFGDPERLPHPVVWFGKAIAFGERRLNKGRHRKAKGALTAIGLIAGVFAATWLLRSLISHFSFSFLIPHFSLSSMPSSSSTAWPAPRSSAR